MSQTLSPLAFDASRWEPILADIARRHHVPGIVAGVLHRDPATGTEQRFAVGHGLVNTSTGVTSTPDTLCQIGSITKVVTATMIMQLCEEGRIELDTAVRDVLPELELASEHTSGLTIRQLLTHTSGVDGDVFTDTGRGDDCVAAYVASLGGVPSLFAPGRGWSYCNTGFVIAGRIIEVLDDRTWDESLRDRVCRRLDLQRFLTLPEEIIAHRSQHGHVREPGQRYWHPSAVATIPRSMGSAGGITSSVDDLLDFGRAFLRGGAGSGGTPLVTVDSLQEMTRPQVTLDAAVGGTAPHWGVGWMLEDWDGHPVWWHAGTTIGNNAWFHVLPEDGLVFVVFCNGGVAPSAAAEVYSAFAQEYAGIHPRLAPSPASEHTAPSGDKPDLDDALLGRYADAATSVELLRADDSKLRARIVRKKLDGSGTEEETVALLPAADSRQRFLLREDDLSPWTPVAFAEVDGVRCAYVGMRCLPRQEDLEQQRPGQAKEGDRA